MGKYERNKLLIRVAKLYYENDYSQEQIAKKVGISRPYVSKLIHAAKQAGIIKIQVIDPMDIENSLEKEIREKYGLKKAIVIPAKSDGEELKPLGEAAARYLDGIIQSGDIIGTSWGNTMLALSNSLIRRADLTDLTYVQMCGGISNVKSAVHASEIANNFSSVLNTSAYLMQVPAVLGTARLKNLLTEDVNMSKVYDLAMQARVAIFTIGAFGVNGERSALVQNGYLNHDQIALLKKQGAVGDICCHMIDSNGNICNEELDERTMAISLENLAKKEYRIAVAEGVSKIRSIAGALKSGVINVLITTDATAKKFMQL